MHGSRPASPRSSPSSSPSTIPSSTARRSPETPDASARPIAAPQPVRDPAEASPATHDLGIAAPQDHVDAVTPKPGALVEAVLAGPRLGHENRRARGSSPEAASGPPAAGAGPARAHRGRRSARCVRECGARTAYGERARSRSRERRRHARSRPTSGYGRSPRAAARPTTSPRVRGRPRAVRTEPVEAPPARATEAYRDQGHDRRRDANGVGGRDAGTESRQAGGAARGRRASRSRHHELAKLLDGRRPDPGHGVQLLDRPKGAVRDVDSRGSSGRSPDRPRAACPAARASPRSG